MEHDSWPLRHHLSERKIVRPSNNVPSRAYSNFYAFQPRFIPYPNMLSYENRSNLYEVCVLVKTHVLVYTSSANLHFYVYSSPTERYLQKLRETIGKASPCHFFSPPSFVFALVPSPCIHFTILISCDDRVGIRPRVILLACVLHLWYLHRIALNGN